ncbi:MAG: hypothetical protein Q9169_001229 [Polycauliona sp. 2 TL-2023]
MRAVPVLANIWLCLLVFTAPLIADARHAIIPRQDPASPSSLATSTPPDAEPAIAASTTTPARKSILRSSDKAAPSTDPPSDGGATSTSDIDPAAVTSTPTTSNDLARPSDATQPKDEKLPIEPTITPALSVAGAILMLTGLFYTLVGIKTKWLHIFLSAAYLTSLAVTVLIVYVMHSPVSNAIQGAYFVAAFVTGVIFGGGSVLFADVTEGLGCVLGGYCLAMWFLILKPDGLIKSKAGKAIFIACFTLGAFGFYISHWTRAYGLIGATSFAGATVIVLGIDCFSRAGLKEFWLYIWGLNDDIFPLRYNGPYPHTRGIRVEIAAIVLLFLVGVMSQMKVWKIIERRRQDKATEQLRKREAQEQAEHDLGRKIEEGNARDLTAWEATYGGKTGKNRHIDSGIGTEEQSVRKASLSIVGTNEMTRSQTGSIEMDDLGHSRAGTGRDSSTESKGKGRATITVRVASDDDVVQTISRPTSTIDGTHAAGPASQARSSRNIESPKPRHSPVKLFDNSGSPKVVPLPFNVPISDADDDRRSSIAASIASEHFSTRVLKRLSAASIKRESSKRSQRSYFATSTSEEALMIPHDDNDRASSVDAAVDEASDGQRSEADATTLAGLPTPDTEKILKFSPPTETHPVDRLGRQISEMSLNQASLPAAIPTGAEDATQEPQITVADTDPTDGPPATAANSLGPEEDHVDDEALPAQPMPQQAANNPPEQPVEKPPMQASLAELDSASKVVMAYRTNEWAKHLDRAENPSFDDIRSLQRQQSKSTAPTERAAPVNIPDLRQTPLNAEPAPAISSSPKLDTSSKPHLLPRRSTSSESKDSLPQSPLQQRTLSQSSLSSQPPQQQRPHQPRHSSSHQKTQAPLTIQEDMPCSTFPQRPNLNAVQTSNTLLSRRENLLQQRPSSTSLTRVPSFHPTDDDNAPLSHRRASLLKNHAGSQRRISSSPIQSAPPYSTPTTSTPNINTNPYHNRNANPYQTHHNPSPYQSHSNRNSKGPQTHDTQTLQLRHSQLLAQKRRSEQSLLEKEREQGRRDREADEMWRKQSSGMEERHREAMRRMQAGVGE